MFKKKQVLILVSIAVISFLLGTTFNFATLVRGNNGSPWDKVWTTISELQTKVDTLNTSLTELQDQVSTVEEKSNWVRTIRIYEPDEKNATFTYVDGAVFIWSPNNSTNNAILSIRCYFQYRCEPGDSSLSCRIVINDIIVVDFGGLHRGEYGWTPIFTESSHCAMNDHCIIGKYGEQIDRNQDNYTIKFQFASDHPENRGFVKDLNIIIAVADGLPASNP